MNRAIARVSTILLVLFGVLFVNLNLITLLQADALANHPSNRRLIVREYEIARGPIVVGEQAIAQSTPTEGELRYLRTYPDGPLYAHLTGYYSIVLQRFGLEAALNEHLTGRPTEVVAQNLSELMGGRDLAGNAVVLTIDPTVQRAAADALGDREGAVVALNFRTGAVLASYANPTYDPNPLTSHDTSVIRAAWDDLRVDPQRPLVDRALRELYAPGSAFKVIVAAAALERGLLPTSMFPDERTFDVPLTTADISNFGGGLCAQGEQISLADALQVSCNTVFARLGVDIGAEDLVAQAERFGFNQPLSFDLPVATSAVPDAGDLDVPSTAQSALGQRDVRATPLQMALVAAAVANDGVLMTPHLVSTIRTPEGARIASAEPERWTAPAVDGRAVSSRTAAQLRTMMIDTVQRGTGIRARIDGVAVGGKTGTAQTAADPIAWFIGFAGDDVAVAVMLPDQPDGTGGSIAAPVARQVMQAALDRRGAG
ncbi:MAG: penicillin-binding protein 2 [Nitriliruptoraceae bacterium]